MGPAWTTCGHHSPTFSAQAGLSLTLPETKSGEQVNGTKKIIRKMTPGRGNNGVGRTLEKTPRNHRVIVRAICNGRRGLAARVTPRYRMDFRVTFHGRKNQNYCAAAVTVSGKTWLIALDIPFPPPSRCNVTFFTGNGFDVFIIILTHRVNIFRTFFPPSRGSFHGWVAGQPCKSSRNTRS